jgi:inosose dehydratase
VSTGMRLAGAPITWGVCEVPGWGHQLDGERVLAEIAEAGLAATELGPRGFLPDDPSELRDRLARHGLTLVGGFVPAVLHREERLQSQLALVDESARTLAGAGAEVLVLAAETGDAGYEGSRALSNAEWETLRLGIAAVEEIGRRHGLAVALHPHYGTVVERDEQVRRLLATTGVPLCLDTGHLVVGGADPVAITRLASGRIGHVHLKDVDAALAARVRAGEIGYRDAVGRGLYRPLGEGDAGIAEIVRLLRAAGYDGWYVIEQDLVLASEREGATALENARRSVRFLAGAAA